MIAVAVALCRFIDHEHRHRTPVEEAFHHTPEQQTEAGAPRAPITPRWAFSLATMPRRSRKGLPVVVECASATPAASRNPLAQAARAAVAGHSSVLLALTDSRMFDGRKLCSGASCRLDDTDRDYMAIVSQASCEEALRVRRPSNRGRFSYSARLTISTAHLVGGGHHGRRTRESRRTTPCPRQ